MDNNEKRFPKPGVTAALIAVLFEFVAAYYIFSRAQYYLGMWGLVLTEIGIALIGLIGAWIVDLDWKEMLPLGKIKLRSVFGTLLMWAGSLFIVLIVNSVFFYFYPQGLSVNQEMDTFFSEWSALPVLFVVAVMPAVCEEIFQRGLVQRCMMKRIRSKFLVAVIMGIFFGIFHMDFYRFPATAILGGILSYILLISENFIYNMLFHFVNNFFAQILSFIAFSETTVVSDYEASVEILPAAVGSYLIIGCITPFMMLGGSMLLKGMKKLREEGNAKIILSVCLAAALSVIMFVSGVIVLINNMSLLNDISM